MFSLGDRTEIARSQIEEFKQGGQHINDFIIKFGVLKEMAKIDDQHAIFLLKRHVKYDIIKVILGYPPIAIPSVLDEWIEAIQSVLHSATICLSRFYLSVYSCMRFTYSRSPLNLPHLSTCSHDYSDTSVIVTQPDSINSYPG
jgi:hypothetical protein